VILAEAPWVLPRPRSTPAKACHPDPQIMIFTMYLDELGNFLLLTQPSRSQSLTVTDHRIRPALASNTIRKCDLASSLSRPLAGGFALTIHTSLSVLCCQTSANEAQRDVRGGCGMAQSDGTCTTRASRLGLHGTRTKRGPKELGGLGPARSTWISPRDIGSGRYEVNSYDPSRKSGRAGE
jgi:hypothetical protein